MTVKILFVCLGNICRSPAAEAVMAKLVSDRGLAARVLCDSAGTGAYHEGERADARMRRHAAARGYDVTSIARGLRPEDFDRFDWILTMDRDNYSTARSMAPRADQRQKIKPITDFCQKYETHEVPDPYYGGAEGFEKVLDLLEDACSGFLATLERDAR